MAETRIVNGVPYGPDIKRLQEAWPVTALTEGVAITHRQLSEVLGQPKGSHRYYAVVNSWIGRQKNDNGIFIVWEHTVGIKVLNPAEILMHAEIRTRQKIGQTGKAIRTFAWVDRARLDDMGQKRLDHQLRNATEVKRALESAKKNLAIDLAPIASLPKPKLIRGTA